MQNQTKGPVCGAFDSAKGVTMRDMLGNMEDILNQHISGFHQYILTQPVRISYVSQNLCDMLGMQKEELLDDGRDLYALQVHPADREKYSEFIQDMIRKEQALTGEYRLVQKNGTIIWVRDTIMPKRLDDGTLIGYSVLTDITDMKNEYAIFE